MNKNIIIGVVVVLIALFGLGRYLQTANQPKNLEPFAVCLKDKGAIFYGAFWCPHCQAQKKLFGSAVKVLPYVECSTPDGQSQLPVCIEAGVKNYPTWKFADGTVKTGEVTLKYLVEKTSCALPE